MRTYTFHEVIDQLDSAKPFAETNFCLTALPKLQTLLPVLRGRLRQKLGVPLVLLQHLLLVLSLIGKGRNYDLVLVRDFLSLPLICFVWMVLPLRNKICFINVQNLQRAHMRRSHRLVFSLLCRMKFRFACLEGDEGLQELGISMTPEQFFCLPHIVVPARGGEGITPGQRKRVGIVGTYRPEKGIGGLIKHLMDIQAKADVDVMIGTPDSAVLKEYLKTFDNDIEVRDTSNGADYAAALQSCDVVLFNYNREDYYYRGSGVITNAVECGASVVCPDYPVFRRQVLSPVPVGYLFEDESKIVETALSALQDRELLHANIEAYSSFRNPRAVAKIIDAFAGKQQSPSQRNGHASSR